MSTPDLSRLEAPLRRGPWTGPFPVVLALGSNLGPRRENLERACTALEARGIRIDRRSRLYATRPLPGSGGGTYLNACLLVHTALDPSALLAAALAVERDFGRVRAVRWAPRALDIDLIFYGSARIDRPALRVPHPAWRERDFILEALRDLAVPLPGLRAPETAAAFRGWLDRAERCILSACTWPPPRGGI